MRTVSLRPSSPRATGYSHGREGLKAGAFDFIEKPFSDQVLLERIQQALQQDTVERSTERDRADIERKAARLTARETQVFELVVAGKPNKVVAKTWSAKPSRSTARTSWRRCAPRASLTSSRWR